LDGLYIDYDSFLKPIKSVRIANAWYKSCIRGESSWLEFC
jgi:hypothetical protein